MRLLRHHPSHPTAADSQEENVDGLPNDTWAQTAHLLNGYLVFAALDHEHFRVGTLDDRGRSVLLPRPSATGRLAIDKGRVAYVTKHGSVVVFEPVEGSWEEFAASASDVHLVPDGQHALVHTSNATEVWDTQHQRLRTSVSETLLSIEEDGSPGLTLLKAHRIMDDHPDTQGPLTYRGRCVHANSTFVFFDSLYGTAIAKLGRSRQEPNRVYWIPEEWFLAFVHEDRSTYLVTQRLHVQNKYDLEQLPQELSDQQAVSELHFALSQAQSRPDRTAVPVSRFRRDSTTSPVTALHVHGGFGISLRPFASAHRLAGYSEVAFAHVRGGGELGPLWSAAGRGDNKGNSVTDLETVSEALAHESKLGIHGASHGGWVALLLALRRPDLVDHLCVASPIINLAAYLESPLGLKHHAEFPSDQRDNFDPSVLVRSFEGEELPHLILTYSKQDGIVSRQNYTSFAAAWQSHGGSCELIPHQGGHYAPRPSESSKVEAAQSRVLQRTVGPAMTGSK